MPTATDHDSIELAARAAFHALNDTPLEWDLASPRRRELMRKVAEAVLAAGDTTVWRLTRSDVEDLAGRPVTDEEASLVADAIDNSDANDVIAAAVDQVLPV